MSKHLAQFFQAWGEADADLRMSLLAGALTPDASYSDPRSGDRLSGIDAIAGYVSMFSANAPGWTASLVTTDTINGYIRATVAFGGPGPDGKRMEQTGTYFVDTQTDGHITMLAGFAG